MASPTASSSYWMGVALEEAEAALAEGEVPVGCVFVEEGREVARAHNATNATLNPTRHAELVAMDSQPDVDWSRTELYVTCEPCIMCAAALVQVGVKKVHFGCRNDKFGGCGSILSLHEGHFACVEGLRSDDAVLAFQRFYARQNSRTADGVVGRPRKKKKRPPSQECPVLDAAVGGDERVVATSGAVRRRGEGRQRDHTTRDSTTSLLTTD
mmetsp:Transcript_22394/g.68963  ORF Transcript_22394/g.68963 Transcript_22394/m.68963 type:complete len:212 (+) Transcript_22394:111-746(+)|eukprot:CAMPEP_0198671246 /NCGR_PEP_ID=MMETSP1467-20131203/85321_1 /TAXON_ID=1462469 /ORGANISM="unid. sp., Strain CCMP2135" /LENGTH=211 /DNA_ID=CAMNT_0044408043 /DNA_START=91 /DNA_END=726 /DNA_ORIENTATION=-